MLDPSSTTRPPCCAPASAREYDTHFAINRPEDVEVDEDGTVYMAITNNSTPGVKDSHGSVRRIREDGNDPLAIVVHLAGLRRRRPADRAAASGFSSPDNLMFDRTATSGSSPTSRRAA